MSNPGPASTVTTANLGGGSPQVIGSASTSLVGFYGETPVDQGAAVTTVTTTAATSTTPYGYATSTQADALVTAVNALISRIQDIGITA